MAIRPFNFYVEMEKNDYTPVGEVKQLDTMELDIKVLENSIPKNLESSEISLYVRKKDGTILEQKENISIVEASEGTIKIKVKNQATACAGMTLFELELKGADGIATTGTFIFVVNERVVNGEVVESKDEIHALVEVEKYVKLAKEELQRFKELQAEMLRTNETMNSQENLRNVAETERISAEEERKEKESERVESESNRVTAEGLRANAESSRANAENSRERKERERVTAEISRVDAEALRISEEKKRVNAENSRANSERSRIDAESVRVAEEKKRVTAETARAENEDARVLAERNREENFSQFEDKINKISSDMSKNTKELKNARTATTGEEFNSLDERIDCEVDRINKKIEVSFLHQEDKESHDINNTVDGMTTDMVIKGRTLQNFKSNVKNYISKWVDNGDNYSLNLPSGSGQPYILYGLTQTLKENQKYTVIVNLIEYTSGVLHFSFMNSEGNKPASTELVAESKGLKKFVFTINNTIKAETLRILPRNGVDNIYSISKNILILEGDWTNKPIPEYFEGIKSFGQEEDKIVELSHGKNIYNWEDLYIYKPEEKWRVIKVPNIPKFELGKTYKVSYKTTEDVMLKIILTYQNGEDAYSASESPLVISKDKGKITGFRFYIEESDYSTNKKFIITNIQIEEGSQATTYEPYKEDKKEVQLSKYGFDEGLRGLNNTDYDELNSIRDVAIKRVEKYTFTGEEILRKQSIYGDVIRFDYKLTNLKFASDIICNNFAKGIIGKENLECINVHANDNLIQIQIKASKLETQDVAGFRKWLKANPTTIYYELAQPVETPLTDPINVKTFNEKTYVSFLNSLKGTSNFKAPVDTVLALSNLTDDIKNKTDKKEADEINERATESLELSEYNHSDINDNIFPYIMDLELMVLDMMELNGYTNKKYKISERAGIHMTSKQALERLIRQKKVTLEDALDRIVRYNDAGRITDAEALELTDLAHEIL